MYSPFWSGFLLCQVLLYLSFLFCVAFPGVCLGRMTRFFLKATPAASSCWLRPLGGYDHRLATPSRRHRSHGSQNMTLVVSAGSSQKVSVTELAVEFDEVYWIFWHHNVKVWYQLNKNILSHISQHEYISSHKYLQLIDGIGIAIDVMWYFVPQCQHIPIFQQHKLFSAHNNATC